MQSTISVRRARVRIGQERISGGVGLLACDSCLGLFRRSGWTSVPTKLHQQRTESLYCVSIDRAFQTGRAVDVAPLDRTGLQRRLSGLFPRR